MPHRPRLHPARSYLGLKHGALVCVAGRPVAFAAEMDPVTANIDHFWITIDTGASEPIRVALSTHSRQNAAAGFDARLEVGVLTSAWTELPVAGVVQSSGLDYRSIDAQASVEYLKYGRADLELLLTEKTQRSTFIDVWGELYIRVHVGVHQVHSMRASCSVSRDLIGRDGAIRFYFPNGITQMLLFKFCGQP